MINSKQSNIFVTKSQKKAKNLALDSNKVNLRILLKETHHERILEKHKAYLNNWNSQE